MPVIAKQIAGILNTDDSNSVMPPSHHKMARNVVFRGNQGNLRVESCKGNRKITNALPAYDNICIGSFYDQLKQRVLYFNYNSYGFNGIYLYDLLTDTVSEVLVSFTDSQEDIFNFDPEYPIPSVNILYRTEEDGDILVWTDRTNRPQALNIKDALDNHYGTAWEASYLTVAKPMPLIAPSCSYKDDATVTINNLRKKLYQFRYRWIYKNLEKSTWSPWSKLFAPANPDDIANDIDPQKNNAIDVIVNTGDPDVVKIEIAARQSLATTFSDPISIKILSKDDGGIYNNELYVYRFYNDSSYPYIDVDESNLLFDYVPQKANTQELLNGNVIIYGGITEGYNFDETLNVDFDVDLVPFNDTASLTFTFVQQDVYTQGYWDGTANTGDEITFNAIQRGNIGQPDEVETTTTLVYTATGGETAEDIRDYFVNAYNTALGSTGITAETIAGNPGWRTELIYPYPNSSYAFCSIVYAGSGGGSVDGIANSIYKHKSRYRFGMVYFDQFGVTNGVVTNAEFSIETPEVTTTGDAATEIPKISVSVSHQPPIWATKYSFVRTSNLTFGNIINTVTADTEKDASYGYMDITNLQVNETGLPTYAFAAGDRVRIIGVYGASSVMAVNDFPVVDLVEDPTINGAAKTGSWLKVPYNAILSAFGTDDNYLIEIYTPASNTAEDSLVYYEFGEHYDVLNVGTADRYHAGMLQSQTSTLPALFEFIRGDFYIKERKIPFEVDLTNVTEVWIIDNSVSDLFPSKVIGNGRPFVVDEYAAEKYFPTLVRYSLPYQQNTSINQTNRFYPANFDEYDRARGDIQRLKVRGTNMRVYQSRGVGVVGVYREMLTNADGSTNLIQSDQIVNRISYYAETFGMGNQYCGLASGSTQDYFTDPVVGAQLRVSNDGITNLTEIYKGQFYISGLLTPYVKTWSRGDGSNAKILGCYDFYEEECITVLQDGAIGSLTATTLSNVITFAGTPVAGMVVTLTIDCSDGDGVFIYTVETGDTLQDVLDALAALAVADGLNVVAAATTLSLDSGAITTYTAIIQIPDVENYTFTFNEKRNAYSSFYDYSPEWICNAQDKTLTWVEGELWVHDTDYAKFYETQFDSEITLVFNDQIALTKTFNTISYQANGTWVSPTTGDIVTSQPNPQTGMEQESQLKAVDYEVVEGQYKAAFLYDANSRSSAVEGLNNGDALKGVWIQVKLTIEPTTFKWLFFPAVVYSLSNRNF